MVDVIEFLRYLLFMSSSERLRFFMNVFRKFSGATLENRPAMGTEQQEPMLRKQAPTTEGIVSDLEDYHKTQTMLTKGRNRLYKFS